MSVSCTGSISCDKEPFIRWTERLESTTH